MKLDRAGAPHKQPLAPEDWTMDLIEEAGQHIAVVARNGVHMCRLSVVAHDQPRDQVRTELAERARAWIAEYLKRQ